MTKFSLMLATAAMLGVTVASNAMAQASPDPKTVKAGTYKIEPYHTQVGFSVTHFGFTEFSGFFSEASGSLTLDPAKPAASKLAVSIPIQSVTTTVAKLDQELKGDEWIDAGKFPTANFVSTAVTSTDPGQATIAGNLTLHGVTKPITLTATFIGAGVNPLDKAYTVGFKATGTIKRSDFGVNKYVPLVGDAVSLTIAGAFELQ